MQSVRDEIRIEIRPPHDPSIRTRIFQILDGRQYTLEARNILATTTAEVAEQVAALLTPGSVFVRSNSGPVWDSPSKNGYHNYELLVAEIDELAADKRGFVVRESIGRTSERREILAFRISPASANAAKRIVLVGCHHACERISVEIPLLVGSAVAEARRSGTRMPRIDDIEFIVVPMLNPDGHEFFVREHDTHRNWRKNRLPLTGDYQGFFGVDLNRNYPFHWGEGDAGTAGSSPNYCGEFAFSENETSALKNLLEADKVDGLLSYHSFSQRILFPWGYTRSGSDPRVAKLQAVAERMALASTSVGFTYEAVQSSKIYNQTIGGELCDWALWRFGIAALTVELPPRSGDPGFWLPASEIGPTFDGHYPAALSFFRDIADGWMGQS